MQQPLSTLLAPVLVLALTACACAAHSETPVPPAQDALTVRGFRLEGGAFIDEVELLSVLGPYQGRALTLAEIEQAASQVTTLYRQHGHPVARAYVPQQDASTGTVTLRVLMGTLAQVSMKNRSAISDALLRQVFAPLQTDTDIFTPTLERTSLIAGDLPGASPPVLTLSPATAPGRSDLDIDVGPGPRLEGHVLADNHGSRYTGENRLGAALSLNTPLGLADRLDLSAMGADGGGLVNARLAYNVPVGADGIRAELAGQRTTYTLGSDYQALGATGETRTAEASLRIPWLRTREHNLVLSLGMAAKRLRDHVAADQSEVPKTVQAGSLGLQDEAWTQWLGLPVYTRVNASVNQGHLAINNAAQAKLNAAGANTQGDFGHLNLGLTAALELAPGWNANATVNLQQALRNRNLDPSEQMNLAGPEGVRAYRESVSGDNGYLVSAELHRALPAWETLTHALTAFADMGRAHFQNGAYASRNGVLLKGVGLGYRLRRGDLFADLQVARAVGLRPDTEPAAKFRVLTQLGLHF